jgi:Spy/CpxP family protein refolding chaperone
MQKLIIALGLAATVAAGASTLSAQRSGEGSRFGERGEGRPGIGGPRRAGGPMRRHQILAGLRAVDLSSEQQAKVREIMQKSRADSAPLLKELADIRLKTRENVRGVLTPEQLAKLPSRQPR